ncbi:hypothetical protein SDC9_145093 [bioreactor metagenome]|uniref:Peptidase C51 domain-containing protein n=1 Tax=bioreactor metagenome TaxID=1076179 RepID=A0A645EAQ9_9ZZZZ
MRDYGFARQRADNEHGESFHAGYTLAFIGQRGDSEGEVVVLFDRGTGSWGHIGFLSARINSGEANFN